MEDQEAIRFRDVYEKECVEIRRRRRNHIVEESIGDKSESDLDIGKDEPPRNLVGLALSGGGIRSATFSLGILQGLHKLKVLRIFDYMSTVSGGGYLGGWWSAWLSRERTTSEVYERRGPFRARDIKHPVSLTVKLSSGSDPMVIALQSGFSMEHKALFKSFGEDSTPSDELIEALVFELNKAVRDCVLYFPLWCDYEHEDCPVDGDTRVKELSPEKYAALVNRELLEEAFPYELMREIFPQRENIEPENERPGLVRTGQKRKGQSRSVWRDPIHHLRLYANYLTPRRGLLSADTWRAISTITRNLIFTWLILLPFLTAIMLLGQLYFLLHPTTSADFVNQGTDLSYSAFVILKAIGWPLAGIWGWIMVMAVAWLWCNRDWSSSTDWIIQLVCLIAVGGLVLIVSHVHPPLWDFLRKLPEDKRLTWVLIIWTALPLASLIYVMLGANGKGTFSTNAGAIRLWKSEVRRSMISRIQTRLMIVFVIVAVVLGLSGFSHIVIGYLFKHRPNNPSESIFSRSLLGLLPVISALCGAVFTALKASPAGGSDKRATREPSAVSRFVFAVTPGLVVIVLAVTVSWLGHELLCVLSRRDVRPLLTIVALCGIALCFALAVYEMNWRELKPTLLLVLFGCFLTINISWGAQAVVTLILYRMIGDTFTRRALIVCFSIGLLVAVYVFIRVAVHEKWLLFIYGRTGNRKNDQRGKNGQGVPRALGHILLLLLVLTGAALSVSSNVLHEIRGWEINPSRLLLGLAVLGGSVILFRLTTLRHAKVRHKFVVKFFSDNPLFRRPAAIWVLGSVCVAFPVAISCWTNALLANHQMKLGWYDKTGLIVFPFLLALLPETLIFFRSMVHSSAKVGAAVQTGSRSVLDAILSKITKPDTHPHHKRDILRLILVASVAGALVAGYGAVKLNRNDPLFYFQWVGLAITWRLIFITVLFSISLAVFKAAVMQLPLERGSAVLRLKIVEKRKMLRQRSFIWSCACACFALALAVGYLTSMWLQQVKEYRDGSSLSSIALPGMVVCFNLAIFEVWWGKGENRRSLWLLASAYLGLALLFVLGMYNQWLNATPLTIVVGSLAVTFIWIVAFGWMVDPNAVSMHQFYKGRLVRAYLGASNVRRLAQSREITDSVAGDDVPLYSIKNCSRGGPYHLINTTLNLVAGRDLATAQRSASSFVLSGGFCGSSRTNYRPTLSYMNGCLTLGTAIAASGAAVSPSMGSKRPTSALAMLLTLLNVRLGYWAPTPNQDNWEMAQPRLWPFYLLREFLSQTNDLSSYCYLTDGGHFDNTGLYSLVERGCRYIVLVDCGADPQPSCFEDLGEAIRRCRIDFGTEFKLDIAPFIEDGNRKASTYFVTGGIRYSRKHAHSLGWKLHPKEDTREDKGQREGVIVYFKPSIIGKETADVRQYAIENKSFPQQTTANQWFDEAQFESYRRLGQLCAKEAFGQLSAVKKLDHTLSLDDIEDMFMELNGKERPSKTPITMFV